MTGSSFVVGVFASRTGARNVVAVLRLRIEDRELVGAELRRAVQLAVAVDGRVAAIGAAQVVHVALLGRPVAHGGDDVALDALRALRLRVRQLALRDAVGPLGEVLQRHAAELPIAVCDHVARRPGRTEMRRIHASCERVELAEARRQRARRELAELVAADAGHVLDRREVLVAARRAASRPRPPSGSFIIEYQYAAGYTFAAVAASGAAVAARFTRLAGRRLRPSRSRSSP